ncbi:MAG: hypothetical protein ABIT69_08675 [Sphingomicrobium sp.]
MRMPISSKHWINAAVAVSLMVVPTFASAATVSATAPQAVSPVVALSFLASDTSRAALCGAAGANAAAAAAATAAATTTTQADPVRGCVLPAIDAVPVAAPLPAAQGFSLLGPLAAVLAGLVAVLVLVSLNNNHDAKPPVSPA